MVQLLSNQTSVYGISHSQKTRQVIEKFRFLKSKPTAGQYPKNMETVRFLAETVHPRRSLGETICQNTSARSINPIISAETNIRKKEIIHSFVPSQAEVQKT